MFQAYDDSFSTCDSDSPLSITFFHNSVKKTRDMTEQLNKKTRVSLLVSPEPNPVSAFQEMLSECSVSKWVLGHYRLDKLTHYAE